MLPFLAPLAISAGAGLVQGVAQSVGDPLAAQQRKRRKELEGDIAKGVGLTGQEEELLSSGMMSPVRQQQTEAMSRLGAAQATAGGNAGDMARLRQEAGRTTADAAQRAAQTVAAQDAAMLRAKQAEYGALKDVQAQRRADTIRGIFGPLAEAASTAAAFGADVPEVTKVAGMFGSRIKDVAKFSEDLIALGLDQQTVATITQMAEKHDGKLADAIIGAFSNGNATPEERAALLKLLQQQGNLTGSPQAATVASPVQPLTARE